MPAFQGGRRGRVGLNGTRNGNAISLFAPGGFGGNDNLFSPGAPYMDFSGFSYTDGFDNFNLYWTGVGTLLRECSTLPGEACQGSATDGIAVGFTAARATVPEPGILALIGIAAVGVVVTQWRKKRG